VADIFICYRTDDAAYVAPQLNDTLTERYGTDRIFIDLTMRPGSLYPETIRTAVRAANVVLAVIGPRWATAIDKTGRPCLDNPRDWVRDELRTALEAKIAVIPVMLDGAKPSWSSLPADLRDIRKLQRYYLRRRSLRADYLLLFQALEQVVPGLKPLPGARTARAEGGADGHRSGGIDISGGRAEAKYMAGRNIHVQHPEETP
jgi:hypothetical protein